MVFAHGPEVRAFLYSGLSEVLARESRVVLLFAGHGRAPQALANGSFDLRPVVARGEPRGLQRARGMADGLHRRWADRRLGTEKWHHYLGRQADSRIGLREKLLSLAAHRATPWRTLALGERLFGRFAGTNRAWKDALVEERVDILVTAGLGGGRVLPALQTAINLGMRTAILTNSWKDVHIKRRLPVKPDLVGIWTEGLAHDYQRFNPGFPWSRIRVTGSLHLAALANAKRVPSRGEFCAQIGMDPVRPIVCYSAAAPRAVMDEEGVVAALASILGAWPRDPKPQLLIRSNPMGGEDRFRAIAASNPGVTVSLPRWEWSEGLDWCTPLPEDLPLWRAIIEYSAVNVSVASTVTLEFAMFGKPVINICFDGAENVPDESSNVRFWNAPFYSFVRENALATPVSSSDELRSRLLGVLSGNGVDVPVPGRPDIGAADVSLVADGILGLAQ